MIYKGSDIVNKISNGNRIYLGNRLIYQLLQQSEEYKLPDVAFIFNYNAKNYIDGFIPNANGALFNEDLVFNTVDGLDVYDDHIYFNSSCSFGKNYGYLNINPLNRSNGQPLTLIAKVRNPYNNELHLLANRSNSSKYNWMFRIYDYAWLHTSAGNMHDSPNVPLDSSQPNIVAIRCLTDGTGYGYNYTTGEQGEIIDVNYGSVSNGFGIFKGYADSEEGETFVDGEFYWLYVSTEQLTDEQIQQVIAYNENGEFTPPSVDDGGDDDIVIEGEWTTLTFDFDKTQPIQEVLIDMNNLNDDISAYCFARFSITPNGEYNNNYFSICVVEDSVYDNGYKFKITNLHNVGGNVFYYKFSQPVYVADIEENFNVSRIKIKIINEQ